VAFFKDSVGSTMMAAGEEGTGGRRPSGAGLRLVFGADRVGKSKVDRKAVAGGTSNDVFQTGADGGGRGGRAVAGVNKRVTFVLYCVSSSGEFAEDDPEGSGLLRLRSSSKPPPIPNNSCSSSSSTRSSLRTLPFVMLLAMDPERFRLP
jgi:hypothetical protein